MWSRGTAPPSSDNFVNEVNGYCAYFVPSVDVDGGATAGVSVTAQGWVGEFEALVCHVIRNCFRRLLSVDQLFRVVKHALTHAVHLSLRIGRLGGKQHEEADVND